MLEVADLSVERGGSPVLHGVSLRASAGEVIAVIGSNGAGKTTLLRAICGLLPVASGAVRLDGTDVVGTSTATLARRGVAYVPAERHLFPDMTVAENLALGAHTGGDDPGTTRTVLDLFPLLGERATQLAGTLSGGEQQMLAVGRALMGRPRLLLLDEPTTGLAPRPAAAAFAALARLRGSGTTVLLAEQQVPLALELADRGYVLEGGRVAIEGTPSALTADVRVREAYLGVG